MVKFIKNKKDENKMAELTEQLKLIVIKQD